MLAAVITKVAVMWNVLPWYRIAVVQWLRRYATNRKVAGSIQHGVTGIFH